MTGGTVAQALAAAAGQGVERLDAQLMLARRLQRGRAWLIAHDDAMLGADAVRGFEADVRRRAAGEPLAYITGRREFHGLALEVTPAVLVPRPDTETLVDWAIELVARASDAAAARRVIDLGTGSGAVALALKHAMPAARVLATDVDRRALELAARNADRLALEVEFRCADWWDGIAGPFDLALSNPPYIAEGDPHLAALRHEPAHALTAGGDGLDALRRLIDGAPSRLTPDAWLLLEHGHDQSEAVQRLLAQRGFVEVQSRCDLAGHARCTGGRRPG